jgi:hypothetical protein
MLSLPDSRETSAIVSFIVRVVRSRNGTDMYRILVKHVQSGEIKQFVSFDEAMAHMRETMERGERGHES